MALPPSCVDCPELWQPEPPGTLWTSNRPVRGLLYLYILFGLIRQWSVWSHSDLTVVITLNPTNLDVLYILSWFLNRYTIKKVKWSRYRPGVAERVGIALLFHDRHTRRGWVVSSTPRPHFTPGKDPVPIVQEAGWAPGPVWTGGKSGPHRDSISGPSSP